MPHPATASAKRIGGGHHSLTLSCATPLHEMPSGMDLGKPLAVARPWGAIFLTVLDFNLSGDGLRDALDARLK